MKQEILKAIKKGGTIRDIARLASKKYGLKLNSIERKIYRWIQDEKEFKQAFKDAKPLRKVIVENIFK